MNIKITSQFMIQGTRLNLIVLLGKSFLKIVQKKPTCIHSMGAVPKPDGGIRPITDCSMPRDISVNNSCFDSIEDFQYNV